MDVSGYYNPARAMGMGEELWSMLQEAQKEKKAEYRKGLGFYDRLTDYYRPQGAFYPQIASAARRSATPAFGMRGIDSGTLSPSFTRRIQDERMKNYVTSMQQRSAYAGKYVPIYPTGEAIGSLVGSGLAAELNFLRSAY